MTARAKDEEHMQGCGALRCIAIIEPRTEGVRARDMVCHNSRECHEPPGNKDYHKHPFRPGPCSCILGELRAEVERLLHQISQLDENYERAMHRIAELEADILPPGVRLP